MNTLLMASPRAFCPSFSLYSSVKSCRPTTYRSISRDAQACHREWRGFHGTSRRPEEAVQQRYGNAAGTRLPPPPNPGQDLLMPLSQNMAPHGPSSSSPDNQHHKNILQDGSSDQKTAQEPRKDSRPSRSKRPKIAPPNSEARRKEDEPATPLDLVLKTQPLTDLRREQKSHHLAPSPYEHHFDTYSLVQDLEKGNFTEEQAVTLMKSVRMMLASNIAIARDNLVSSSDVQNETYLFKAACGELRTSLQSSRHSEIQRQRTQRAQLHHEYDILNQKVTQDMLNLRDELKALFHDRKMAVQEEKQRLDSKISELNYEISVLLNSDSKSEVEGLRWILTRRAAMAIAAAAGMTLMFLNYSSYRARAKDEVEKKVTVAAKAEAPKEEHRPATSVRDRETQTAPAVAESCG